MAVHYYDTHVTQSGAITQSCMQLCFKLHHNIRRERYQVPQTSSEWNLSEIGSAQFPIDTYRSAAVPVQSAHSLTAEHLSGNYALPPV